MARVITITDQLDRDGNIIDQIANWTDQIPKKMAMSKTVVTQKRQEVLDAIIILQVELADYDELLVELNK